MKQTKPVYIIKTATGKREYEKTNIAFSSINLAAEFCYNFINDEHRFTYERGELTDGIRVYDSYEDFVKENPQTEIRRLEKDRSEILVEFPFTVFRHNIKDGTVLFTKLEKLRNLMVLMCQKIDDRYRIRISLDEYLEIDSGQFADFDKAVAKARGKYEAISREIERVKDYYLPREEKNEDFDLEEIYRAFEEE